MPNSNTWALEISPQPLRGRLVGGLATFLFLGQFFSPLLTEPLAKASSLSGMFLYTAASATGLLLALFLFGILKKL